MVTLTKRRKFVLISLLLTLGLWGLSLVGFELKYRLIVFLSLSSGFLTFWSLKGAAANAAVWLTPVLPFFFTAGVALFYFLLPASFLTIVPILVIYFVGLYALLLTLNIFSVAAIRTINLFHSASAVGFLITLLTAFFLYDTIFSFKMIFYFIFFAVLFVSFPLVLVSLWSVNLEEKLTKSLFLFSVILSFFLAQLALAISFWPITVTVGSLFLTTGVYVLLGLAQAYLNEKLFAKTIREYLLVGIVVFSIVIIYTQWG